MCSRAIVNGEFAAIEFGVGQQGIGHGGLTAANGRIGVMLGKDCGFAI